MKQLLLVSAFDEVYKKLNLLNQNLNGKRVTFIPTASNVEEINFYVESGKEALNDLGLIVDELDISMKSYEEINNKLRENDLIYVTGGNTFYLLQELRKTGSDKIIIEEIQNGKIYIGESAGAIVLSKSIKYAEELDDPRKATNLNTLDGLDIVDFYTVPHFKSPVFDEGIKNIESKYKDDLNLCLITNKQAIVIKEDIKNIVTAD